MDELQFCQHIFGHHSQELKGKLYPLIHGTVITKRGDNRYAYISIFKGSGKQTVSDLLIDTIHVKFENMIFRQEVGTPIGINRAFLLADLYPNAYVSERLLDWQNQTRELAKHSGLSMNRYLS